MSEQAAAHNYAGQMEALGVAMVTFFGDVGAVVSSMDTAAATLGALSAQASTAKEALTEEAEKLRTAGNKMVEAGAKLESSAIISPNHTKIKDGAGAGIEGVSALTTAKQQYATAAATLETQSGQLNERKTQLEADSAALKEFVRQGETLTTEIGGAAQEAGPAW